VNPINITVWDSVKGKRIRQGFIRAPESQSGEYVPHLLFENSLWMTNQNNIIRHKIITNESTIFHSFNSCDATRVDQIIALPKKELAALFCLAGYEYNKYHVTILNLDKKTTSTITFTGNEMVNCMALTKENEIAFARNAGIQLYSLKNKVFNAIMKGHSSDIYKLAAFQRNSYLISCAYLGELMLWNTATKQCLRKFESTPYQNSFHQIFLYSNESFLAKNDTGVYLYSIYENKWLRSSGERCVMDMVSQDGMLVGHDRKSQQIKFWM